MNIYEFVYPEGQTDWVFAPDVKEAKEFYLSFTDCGDLIGVKVKRVPKRKWNEMYILDTNESEPYEGEYNKEDYYFGYKIIESFADYAAKNKYTDIIATTQF